MPASGSQTTMPAEPGKPVVIDTNIILDIFVFADAAAKPVRQALEAGELDWIATRPMRDELARVLDYPQIVPRLKFYQLSADDVLAVVRPPRPPARSRHQGAPELQRPRRPEVHRPGRCRQNPAAEQGPACAFDVKKAACAWCTGADSYVIYSGKGLGKSGLAVTDADFAIAARPTIQPVSHDTRAQGSRRALEPRCQVFLVPEHAPIAPSRPRRACLRPTPAPPNKATRSAAWPTHFRLSMRRWKGLPLLALLPCSLSWRSRKGLVASIRRVSAWLRWFDTN